MSNITRFDTPSKRAVEMRSRYGPWAIVTGASDGIGREFARELALDGLNLVLVARRADRLQALADELRTQHSVECVVIAIDLSGPGASAGLFAQTASLDIGLLVAAAGFGSSGPFIENAISDETEMLSVNCAAALEQCHHYGSRFAKRKRGGIVLLSSLLAFQGTPRSTNYAATKAYIQSLAEGLRVELKARGVDVIAAAPGPINTGFAKRANMRMSQALSPNVVAKRTLAALGRATTVRPGWLSKMLGWSLAMAPRPIRVMIISKVMAGMTAHQDT